VLDVDGESALGRPDLIGIDDQVIQVCVALAQGLFKISHFRAYSIGA
jgi:hypothetical protein